MHLQSVFTVIADNAAFTCRRGRAGDETPCAPIGGPRGGELRVKLMRAQVKEFELSNRILGHLWFRRCVRGALFWGVLLWLILHFIHAASAQSVSRSYYNERGSFAGSSVTRGNSSSFYDGQGRFSGSAIRHGKWTSFYDGRGRYTGSSITTSPQR
jgi:hypothetical protein